MFKRNHYTMAKQYKKYLIISDFEQKYIIYE